ncbi:MAG: helix-turn-helix transcriptional regulator [Myxococcales bacterium]|nr:helix-turn-helix transcriptional regulator [Myxococcales bacterium]
MPPADAPAVALRGSTAPGRPPRSGAGRPRAAVPMRALVALWAHGFSALAIEAIAHAAGLATSSSALGRLLAQAGAAFAGAEARRAAELVAESPLPDVHRPRAFAARMQAWRAQQHLTKTRAARLAGVSPAAWRHLERGEPDARPAAVEAVARLIEQGRSR